MNLNFSSIRYVRQALTIGIVVITAMVMLGACNWYNIGIGQRCCVDPNPLPTVPTTINWIPPVSTTLPCNEDEPCWDCATMGNKVCGVNSPQAYDGYGYTTSEPKATTSPQGYVCRVEPSTTAVGYEVVAYPVSTPTNRVNPLGFYVPCPK